MDSDLGRLLYDYLLKMGMSEGLASDLNFVLLLVVVLVLAFLLDLVVWKVLRAISIRLARRTKNNYDNFLVAHKVPRSVAHIFPLLFLFEFLPVVFVDFDYAGGIALKIVKILFVLQTLAVFRRFFKSTKDYLKILPKFKDKPIASYTQVFMIEVVPRGVGQQSCVTCLFAA